MAILHNFLSINHLKKYLLIILNYAILDVPEKYPFVFIKKLTKLTYIPTIMIHQYLI
jgi:hypothetical protein